MKPDCTDIAEADETYGSKSSIGVDDARTHLVQRVGSTAGAHRTERFAWISDTPDKSEGL